MSNRYIFARFQTDLTGDYSNQTQARTIPTFLTLYCFGFFYQLVLVWDALRLKNTIQVIGLCLYNVGLLLYGAIQLDQIRDAVLELQRLGELKHNIWLEAKPFLIAIPCVLALTTALMAFIAWKLYDEFAWTIYKHISADLRMKKRYLTYQVYIALLKFDFFFFLGFTVQFIVIVKDKTTTEYVLTIAAIPVTIIILLFAAFFTRRENKLGMIITIVSLNSSREFTIHDTNFMQICYFGALAYFCFKMFRMYQPSHEDAYKPARKELTTFAAITILLIVCTITNAFMCMANFNKGLKPHVSSRKLSSDEEKLTAGATEMDSRVGGVAKPTQSRMTID